MLPDGWNINLRWREQTFQSALRFAVLPDRGESTLEGLWELVSIRFKVRGASRLGRSIQRTCRRLTKFQSALRFAVLPDNSWHGKRESRLPFQSALRFAVLPDAQMVIIRAREEGFQSALRFAVLPDPTPWHAVLTSPVAAVLHTAPPHPLQPEDRTCPQRGKTPSQVPYTPEAIFGRSPTPLSGGGSKTPSRQPGVPASSKPYPHAIPSRDEPVTQGSANSVAWVV